jgi:hypothetical protein
MMSRQSFLLALIALVCMIFVGSTQSSPLDRRSFAGAVAYAEFTGEVTGFFTWTNIPGDKCRVTGQWNTGFESADVDEYSYFLEDDKDKVIQDLTKEINSQISINPPGTSPFQCDFPFSLMSVQEVEEK